MARSRSRFAWIAVVLTALAAQAMPSPCCGGCDRPCCAGQAEGCGPGAAETATTAACPVCAAAAAAANTDADTSPCQCRLQARQEQFGVPSQGSFLVADDVSTAAWAAPSLAVPPRLGASREYLAASLAVPIRPPRILFGVWRN